MEKRIEELIKKMEEWDNSQNEGSSDGYNPYRDQIEKIQNKIAEAKNVTWTKEITIARRKAWGKWVIANAKNGKVDAKLVGKKITEQGWNIQDLKEAVEKHKI